MLMMNCWGCFSFLNEDAHVIECGVDLFSCGY